MNANADQPAHSINVTAEANNARFRARRVMLMSRGLGMAAAGVWILSLQGLGVLMADMGAAALVVSALVGAGLGALVVGIDRRRARHDCHVRTFRPTSWKEMAGLLGGIAAGVIVLLALILQLPTDFDGQWLVNLGLWAFALVFAAYFVQLGRQAKLWEPVLLAIWLLGLAAVATCGSSLSEAAGERVLTATFLVSGLLMTATGFSLHCRWMNWRESTLHDGAAGAA